MRTRILRYLIVLCFLSFVLATIALPLARPGMSLRGNQISALLAGQYSPGARAAFIALAAGAAGLGHVWQRSGQARFAGTLWVYAAATLAAGLTPPQSWPHDVAALTAFAAVPVAVSFATFLTRRTRAILITLIIATLATWPLGAGLGERITVYGEIAFLAWATFASPDQDAPAGPDVGRPHHAARS